MINQLYNRERTLGPPEGKHVKVLEPSSFTKGLQYQGQG